MAIICMENMPCWCSQLNEYPVSLAFSPKCFIPWRLKKSRLVHACSTFQEFCTLFLAVGLTISSHLTNIGEVIALYGASPYIWVNNPNHYIKQLLIQWRVKPYWIDHKIWYMTEYVYNVCTRFFCMFHVEANAICIQITQSFTGVI